MLALAEHVSIYAGFPRAISATRVIGEVLAELGLAPQPSLLTIGQSGLTTTVAQVGDHGPAVLAMEQRGQLISGVPAHCVELVIALADECARNWTEFTEQLRARADAAA